MTINSRLLGAEIRSSSFSPLLLKIQRDHLTGLWDIYFHVTVWHSFSKNNPEEIMFPLWEQAPYLSSWPVGLVHSRYLINIWWRKKRQREGRRRKIVIRVAKLPTGWLRKRVTTLYSLRWILLKKITNVTCWWGWWGEIRTLLLCWWECKMVQWPRETIWQFLK